MGYTATREQRVQLLVAIRRMPWSECRPCDHSSYLTTLPLRTVAVAVLATAAKERGHEGFARPLLHLVRIGVAQLPDGRRVVGLDDGTTRQYLLDLGSEAISVLLEPAHRRTARQGSAPSLTHRLDDRDVYGESAPDVGGSL